MLGERITMHEFLEYVMMSGEGSSIAVFPNVENAREAVFEIVSKGAAKNAFVYLYNHDDTYRRVNLNAGNKQEWEKLVSNDNKDDVALLADCEVFGEPIVMEMFPGVHSNIFGSKGKKTTFFQAAIDAASNLHHDNSEVVVFVRYINKDTYVSTPGAIKTEDIQSFVLDIVRNHKGKMEDTKGETIECR